MAAHKPRESFPVCNQQGVPKVCVANAMHALREFPEWSGVLGYDTFSMRTAAMLPTPWDSRANAPFVPRVWNDIDDIRAAEWLQHRELNVNPDVARQAVEAVARQQAFNPVEDYLDSLEWDGQGRVAALATNYFGAESSPYMQSVSIGFLVSAVARIKQPGCKADAMPVFEGPQNAGKSSAVDAMFSPWFSDEMADPGSKDAAMQLQGAWCIEIAELDAFSKAETTRIKAFLSRRKDRFRPPYGSRVSEFPRQCIFAGTTNKDDYLRDETGGRRFWPIKCGRIKVDAIALDRDQLWAEARVLFERGVKWWLDPQASALAAMQQEKRYASDAWEDEVLDFIAERNDLSMGEILEGVLMLTKKDWHQREQNRVARILNKQRYPSGNPVWERRQIREHGKRIWRYFRLPDRPDETEVETAVTRTPSGEWRHQ